MFKKNILLTILLCIGTLTTLHAAEGLWLPSSLPGTVFRDMQKKGLKISAKELYAINKACLKDAILSLSQEDGFASPYASASLVSQNGLVITNFHCVMSNLQRISDVSRDFIRDGYWASGQSEETHLVNLQVNQLMELNDVTHAMTYRLDTVKDNQKETEINRRSANLVKTRTKGLECVAKIYSIAGGTQYIMAVYRVFRDVRMVASPPVSIGKFGGDTDNWQWPRFSGDFAFLRIYADKNNQPALYSKDNVPYHPVRSLKISTKGVSEGDFALSYGFPASTRTFIPSFALEKIIFKDNVAEAEMLAIKRDIYKAAMQRNDTLRVRYTPRVSSLQNFWLLNQGEIEGVKSTGLLEQKKQEEAAFQAWAETTPERKKAYGSLLSEMQTVYEKLTVYNLADTYFNATAVSGATVIPFAGKFEKLMAMARRKKVKSEDLKEEAAHIGTLVDDFFDNVDLPTDQILFQKLLENYVQNVSPEFYSKALKNVLTDFQAGPAAFVEKAYKSSLLTQKDSLFAFLDNVEKNGTLRLESDILYQLSLGFYYVQTEKVQRERGRLQKQNGDLYYKYLEGLYTMQAGKARFPDANKTPRIAYGVVEGARLTPGNTTSCQTTLDGMFERANKFKGNPDFAASSRLYKLLKERDLGRFAKNDTIYTSFLCSIHTSSGNSGSPVLNGKGELVGLVFDRMWQGLASDYRYDPDRSRAIAVDIRYVLFLIEKYGKSQYLLNELQLH